MILSNESIHQTHEMFTWQAQAEVVETQMRCLQTVSGRQKMALRRISAALRESGKYAEIRYYRVMQP